MSRQLPVSANLPFMEALRATSTFWNPLGADAHLLTTTTTAGWIFFCSAVLGSTERLMEQQTVSTRTIATAHSLTSPRKLVSTPLVGPAVSASAITTMTALTISFAPILDRTFS